MNNVISEYRNQAFQWGKHDCCLFACDVILAKIGRDLAENHRGTYSTHKGSILALKTHGSILDILDANFERLDHINYAQRGDVVVFKSGEGMGVVWSGGVLTMSPESGFGISNEEVDIVWRVK